MERRLDAAARKVAAMERENQMALARCAQFVQQHKQSTVQALGGPGKQNKEADMKKQMSMVVETGGRRQLKEDQSIFLREQQSSPSLHTSYDGPFSRIRHVTDSLIVETGSFAQPRPLTKKPPKKVRWADQV